MSVEFKKTITSCMDCPNHEEVRDPDPHDSFCSDDVAILCSKTENTENRRFYYGPLYPNRPVTTSCRPYKRRDETDVPLWCPLRGNKNEPLYDVGL